MATATRETEMITLRKPLNKPTESTSDITTLNKPMESPSHQKANKNATEIEDPTGTEAARKMTYSGPRTRTLQPSASSQKAATIEPNKAFGKPAPSENKQNTDLSAPSESKENTDVQDIIKEGHDESLQFDDLNSIWADLEAKNAQVEINLDDLDADEDIFSATHAIPAPAEPEPSADEFTVEKLHTELSSARNEDDEELQKFFTDFKSQAPEQEVIIGSVAVDDVEKQEQLFEEERLKQVQVEIDQYQACQQNLLRREKVARRHILKERKKVKSIMKTATKTLLENAHKHRHLLRTYFKRSEEKLKSVIKTEQAVVHTEYGDLEKGERLNMKRWRTAWKHKPIPLEITVTKVSAVKDKLDAGVYVLLCSLFDHLGGKPMKWTKAKDMAIKPATEPVVHKGRFYDIDMTFDQKIFIIAPSETKIEPSMTISFELYRLADQKIPIDRCVGWGVMPLCDSQMHVAHGKFKLPLLCGPIDRRQDRYAKLADWYQADLNRWLANLYFEIKHLPREVFRRNDAGPMKEFDVQLSLTGELLGLHRGKTLANKKDENNKKDGSEKAKEVVNNVETQKEDGPETKKDDGPETKKNDATEVKKEKPKKPHPLKLGDERLYHKIELSKTVRERIKGMHGHSHQKDSSFDPREYRMSLRPDRQFFIRDVCMHVHSMRHDKDVFRLKFFWWSLWSDFGFSQLKGYSFWMGLLMLVAAFFVRIYVHYAGQYLMLNIIAEFPVYRIGLSPFHLMVKYTNTLLSMQLETLAVLAGVVMNMLTFLVCIVIEALGNQCGMRMAALSHFFCFFGIMTVLDPVCVFYVRVRELDLLERSIMQTTDHEYMIVATYVLILVVDLIMGNYNCEAIPLCANDIADPLCQCVTGDFFKLPVLTEQEHGSPFIGILITLGLYLGLMVLSTILLYLYTMWIFMNQKIRDLYWRVHAAHDAFFLPEDLEVSMAELEWIMNRAKKWIGPSSSSRKAYVCDYVLSDPLDPHFQEVTSHLALYTMQIDGSRKLYRHFIKRPDGCIVEVFGDVSVHLQKAQTSIERVLRMEDGSSDDFLAP